MTKAECLNELIYSLKMHDSVDFEIDEAESFSADKLNNGGYRIQSSDRYMEAKNLTEVRKVVSKLGKQILVL